MSVYEISVYVMSEWYAHEMFVYEMFVYEGIILITPYPSSLPLHAADVPASIFVSELSIVHT